MRLRTVSCQQPGWRRVRRGRGFSYVDAGGNPLTEEQAQRVRALVIPPAWTDVWVCPVANGHLQAVGTDDAGRRQYLYHPQWRVQRDLEKFERVQEMASRLPSMRRKVRRVLAEPLEGTSPTREQAVAAAVRLIDLGYFRIGAESYAAENGSFGLSTLQRNHVRREGDGFAFAFVGKSGIEHDVHIADRPITPVLDRLMRSRHREQILLASKVGARWRPLAPDEINETIRDLLGMDATAKDFRTWHATVTVARELSQVVATTAAARRRAVPAAIDVAAGVLGNTRSVARSSYVDPRVIDLYEEDALGVVPRGQAAGEAAVLTLLQTLEVRSPAA
ncbi:DNA topoisomerase-1 [Marmoricola sp. OAE513]|uniref:DNA topoisomerase IB n=1 Tax=Marmoricola sp. OAE513 TaxID=2817894 RepID=UPI001D4DBC45